MTCREVVEFIERDAKKRNVQLSLVRTNSNFSGYWNPEGICLKIDRKYPESMLTSWYHELGHEFCYKNNIFKQAHTIGTPRSRKQLLARLSTGLRAEKYVDSWAEKEMRKYFPNLQYNKTYHTPEGVSCYRKFYLKPLFKTYAFLR